MQIKPPGDREAIREPEPQKKGKGFASILAEVLRKEEK